MRKSESAHTVINLLILFPLLVCTSHSCVLVVTDTVINVVVFQPPVQSLKGGSFNGVLHPALQHYLVQRGGALGRTSHAVSSLYLLEDLGIGHSGVGCPSSCDNLSEKHSKWPHVRLDGEAIVEGSLRSGPLDGKLKAWATNKLTQLVASSLLHVVST